VAGFEVTGAIPVTVNREAELRWPTGVVCSALGHIILITRYASYSFQSKRCLELIQENGLEHREHWNEEHR